jgi:hypothetical protein
MWIELASMIAVSFCAAISPCVARFPWLWPSLCVVIGAALGTIGVGILGATASIGLIALSGRKNRTAMILSFWFALGVVLIASLFVRSGLGRWLGIAEAIEMAVRTSGVGVGWGRWAFHQAETQRTVLALFPFASWKEIAPYFGVAPSLPFHLLAEVGVPGLLFWIAAVGLTGFLVSWRTEISARGVAAFLFTFLLTSVVTTPFQVFLTVDGDGVVACNRAIEKFRVEATQDLSPLHVCPEIRTLEWAAAATGTQESFIRWHETFPGDVMPPFALARMMARAGNESEALRWLELAAKGNPGRDPGAQALKEEARRIASGGRERLRLWAAIPSDRPAPAP